MSVSRASPRSIQEDTPAASMYIIKSDLTLPVEEDDPLPEPGDSALSVTVTVGAGAPDGEVDMQPVKVSSAATPIAIDLIIVFFRLGGIVI
jgi:hypothetical protein